MLTLEMTDRPTVERFALVVGYGYFVPTGRILKGRLPLWRWRASSAPAVRGAADLLLPYLVTKQAEVQAALAACDPALVRTYRMVP